MLNSEEPFAFAGIWREKKDEVGIEPHCVIITTEPNEVAGKIYDYISTMLLAEAEQEWLDFDATTGGLSVETLLPISFYPLRPRHQQSPLVDNLISSANKLSNSSFPSYRVSPAPIPSLIPHPKSAGRANHFERQRQK